MQSFNVFKNRGANISEAIFSYLSNMTPESAIGLANMIAENTQKLWVNEINSHKRNSWGDKYSEGINVEPMRRRGEIAHVYVDEDMKDERTNQKNILFANMFEEGVKSWSIKDALMTSKKVKTNRKGEKYIHIPLRYRTPGSQKPSSSFAGVAPDEVYDLVKKQSYKMKGNEIGEHAGMTKVGRPGHEGYMMFRAVSQNSAGWQYPATPGTPVFQKVLNRIDGMIDEILSNFCEAIVKEVKNNARS